ncbi:hypothetical protein V8E54_004489 [Elaphomyces granulatus]|jgi:ribosomal protein L32
MALQTIRSISFLQLFPRLSLSTSRLRFSSERSSQHWSNSSPFNTSASLLGIASLDIPSLFSDIWDSVLRAVPKKKTSHMKKRHRQMAGKALKDVKSLNSCPGCGQPKRAHFLCSDCVKDIKSQWNKNKLAEVTN